MTAWGALTAASVFLAVMLVLPPRPAIDTVSTSRVDTAAAPGSPAAADRGILFRLRWLLAGLAFAAGCTTLGGVLGLLVGVLAGGVSLRAMTMAEGPAARRRREELARDLPVGVDLLGATVAAGWRARVAGGRHAQHRARGRPVVQHSPALVPRRAAPPARTPGCLTCAGASTCSRRQCCAGAAVFRSAVDLDQRRPRRR